MTNRAEELITQLEAEIVKRDARIVELDDSLSCLTELLTAVQIELAALKARQQSAGVVDERAAFEAKFPPEDGVEWSDGDQRYEAFTAFDRSRQHAVDWQNSMLEVWQARASLNPCRAQSVPDGYVLVPERMHLDANVIEAINFHCGDGQEDAGFGSYTDGLLWVGFTEDDDGVKSYGLNIATAEYPEEGSTQLVEFAAAPSAQQKESE